MVIEVLTFLVNAPSSFPVIRSSHEEFIQENKQPKIRLLVGQTASVMVGTIVVIKCQVHKYVVVSLINQQSSHMSLRGYITVSV